VVEPQPVGADVILGTRTPVAGFAAVLDDVTPVRPERLREEPTESSRRRVVIRMNDETGARCDPTNPNWVIAASVVARR
jgi:hypothetical protein